jgi:DNA-binding FadR family transcriptional regulator
MATTGKAGDGRDRRGLVQRTAARLRERVLEEDADVLLGSLNELAREMGVGIVTVQQASRVLEHEGLLSVRRGPGGGYYTARPDQAALERAIDSFMRTHPASFDEALDITSLLFNELVRKAARCPHESLRAELRALDARVDASGALDQLGIFEADFQDLLFRMVERPLFEALTRVTLAVAGTRPAKVLGPRDDTIAEWKAGRHRIIAAILAGDEELAGFEAHRSNRRAVVNALGSKPRFL